MRKFIQTVIGQYKFIKPYKYNKDNKDIYMGIWSLCDLCIRMRLYLRDKKLIRWKYCTIVSVFVSFGYFSCHQKGPVLFKLLLAYICLVYISKTCLLGYIFSLLCLMDTCLYYNKFYYIKTRHSSSF